jgi:hypothetical protein
MERRVVSAIVISIVAVGSVTAYLSWISSMPKSQFNTNLCQTPLSQQGLPVAGSPWFTATVNYSGSWVATFAIVTQARSGVVISSSEVSGCYVGHGRGFFEYQAAELNKSSTIHILATKLGGDSGVLYVAVDGVVNSTTLPFGSATVSATADS